MSFSGAAAGKEIEDAYAKGRRHGMVEERNDIRTRVEAEISRLTVQIEDGGYGKPRQLVGVVVVDDLRKALDLIFEGRLA